MLIKSHNCNAFMEKMNVCLIFKNINKSLMLRIPHKGFTCAQNVMVISKAFPLQNTSDVYG
jgi:hypothetical protein